MGDPILTKLLIYFSYCVNHANLKTVLLALIALIMIASLVFTIEMSHSQSSTVDSNDYRLSIVHPDV